ncbi:MAG: IclR family transcriptional regulator [Spirochaetaceae bacterium]|nr:IclR family transcriptional regulator [Spirochaetaceae bacterium]
MSESAIKAFDLLFHLSRAGSSSLARLSRETGWDKATALRYLTAMEKRGVVERREGDWTLGLALLELASRVPVTENIASRVKPVLNELAKATGETANLSALTGSELMYLAKADGGRALRLRSNPGDRMPLYCTAAGKCILSRFSVPLRAQYLAETHLSAVAPKTIVDPEKLAEDIERTIRRGWAIDDEELESGLICYAMPLDLPRYGFSGAISISGPSGRMLQAQEEILASLRWAVMTLQEDLGGGVGDEGPQLFSPARGGFKSTDWHRPGSETYE